MEKSKKKKIIAERIDMKAFKMLDREAIMVLMNEYPMGIKLKFIQKHRQFLESCNMTEIDSFPTKSSLTSNSSNLMQVSKNF